MGLGAKRTRTLSPTNVLATFQETDGLGRYPIAPAGKTETLGGRATYAYSRRFDAQGLAQVLAHLVPVVPYLRTLADDDRVYVRHLPGLADYRSGFAQELHGVRVLEVLVGVGEVVANVF